MSNFEIATLDLREKADVRPLFSGANFKITGFEIGSTFFAFFAFAVKNSKTCKHFFLRRRKRLFLTQVLLIAGSCAILQKYFIKGMVDGAIR
jgi:hypothetical protein